MALQGNFAPPPLIQQGAMLFNLIPFAVSKLTLETNLLAIQLQRMHKM